MPVLLDMAISLDGHIGRDHRSDPGLYDWYFEPSDISKPVVDEIVDNTGPGGQPGTTLQSCVAG